MFQYQESNARACARAPTRTNKKRAQARARAREIEGKIRAFSNFSSEGEMIDFNDFTKGRKD